MNCLGPIRSPTMVAMIATGMNHTEVREILGAPTELGADNSWTYYRILNPGWLVIHFGANDRVEFVDHETVF